MSAVTGQARASVLSEALPHIRKYNKKTVVVKYGGAAMADDATRDAVISDIVLLSLVSIRMVVVHGGGPEINGLLNKIGKQPKFINGLRHTDEETISVNIFDGCEIALPDIFRDVTEE